MADNAGVKSDAVATLFNVAADEATYSGDAAKIQLVRLVEVFGAEGAKVILDALSNYHVVSAGSVNAASIKASPGRVYCIHVFNNGAYPVYVKFHNTAGTPSAGSGVVFTVGCQAGVARDIELPGGLPFSTGIGITIVKDIADGGTTAVLASDCVVDVGYK